MIRKDRCFNYDQGRANGSGALLYCMRQAIEYGQLPGWELGGWELGEI